MLVMNGTEISYSAKVVCQLLAREHVVKKKAKGDNINTPGTIHIVF